jgi:hypothetical protein
MPGDFDHPADHYTIAAFHLQRVRLGHICREISDLRWSTEIDQVPIERIRSVDEKFDKLLNELPAFLRLDKPSKLCYAHFDAPGSSLRLQRYVMNLGAHAKRCKFHLPFLLRASFDPNYRFCREACLRSARTVIEIRDELLQEEEGSLWIANARLCAVLHLYFYATVVLVMDLCVNRGEECEKSRLQEIREACKGLEDAKRQSSAAGLFLDSLLTILRKHRIRTEGKDCPNSIGASLDAGDRSNTLVNDVRSCSQAVDTVLAPGDAAMGEFDLDSLWQTYVGAELAWDPQSLDALITDIETMPRDDEFLGMHAVGF